MAYCIVIQTLNKTETSGVYHLCASPRMTSDSKRRSSIVDQIADRVLFLAVRVAMDGERFGGLGPLAPPPGYAPGHISSLGGIYAIFSPIYRIHGRTVTKVIIVWSYQVHITLMTFSRSWLQRSRSQTTFPQNALFSYVRYTLS